MSTFTLNHTTIASNETGAGGRGRRSGTGTTPTPGTAGVTPARWVDSSPTVDPYGNTSSRATRASAAAGGVHRTPQNLYSDNASCPGALHGNPLLGPLANNGGPAFTMMLAAGSDALNQVRPSGAQCHATDQRQVTRPKGTGV